MKDELLKACHKVDGIYEVPVEVFEDLIDDNENKKLIIDDLIIRVTDAIKCINAYIDDDCSEFQYMYEPKELLNILEGDK